VTGSGKSGVLPPLSSSRATRPLFLANNPRSLTNGPYRYLLQLDRLLPPLILSNLSFHAQVVYFFGNRNLSTIGRFLGRWIPCRPIFTSLRVSLAPWKPSSVCSGNLAFPPQASEFLFFRAHFYFPFLQKVGTPFSAWAPLFWPDHFSQTGERLTQQFQGRGVPFLLSPFGRILSKMTSPPFVSSLLGIARIHYDGKFPAVPGFQLPPLPSSHAENISLPPFLDAAE